MAKKIDPTLLWESLCWVMYQYGRHTPEAQHVRPIRAYQPDDGKWIALVIRTIRHAYANQKLAFRYRRRISEPDFESMRELVIESLRLQHRWDERTRNLYSSVASTYITWDYGGKSDVSKRKLAVVVEYGNMFLNPNHRIECGQQKLLPL